MLRAAANRSPVRAHSAREAPRVKPQHTKAAAAGRRHPRRCGQAGGSTSGPAHGAHGCPRRTPRTGSLRTGSPSRGWAAAAGGGASPVARPAWTTQARSRDSDCVHPAVRPSWTEERKTRERDCGGHEDCHKPDQVVRNNPTYTECVEQPVKRLQSETERTHSVRSFAERG